MKLFVSCSGGLEPALAEELIELGYPGRPVDGGFETHGDPAKLERWSRIASRVNGGRELYKRGYREEIGRAPLRETLAAGVLRLAGYKGEEPLWDPMCGSGTLLIEAALIATQTPPGDLQHHGRTAPFLLRGTDLNAGALGTTRRNARRAGLTLDLERADAAKIRPTGPPGLLVANLPYGKRVAKAYLKPVLENFATHFKGWRYALLTQGQLPARREYALMNGGLRCRLCIGVW